jgi:predicted branched-subunit amino acid permease
MTDQPTTVSGATPRWTLDGFRIGVMAMLPLLPALMAFAITYGTVAARKGFTLGETMLMSATVFAGVVQVVSVEAWPDRLTVTSILALAILTATVNMRFLLMGASLRPWLGNMPPSKIYPTLALMTDTGWLLAMRYRQQGGNDAAMLLGTGVTTWTVWVLSCIPGYLLGSAIGDPRVIGLDLMVPVFFAAMLVPLWKGARRAVGWVVAALVALVVEHYVGGWWFIMAGAIAGSVTGGLLDDRE